MGAATWPVEEWVREALHTTPDPSGAPANTLFVPSSARLEVLQWDQGSKLVCHPGLNCTLHLVRQRFWWLLMVRDTRAYIAACAVCAQGKSSYLALAPELADHPATALVPHSNGLCYRTAALGGTYGNPHHC